MLWDMEMSKQFSVVLYFTLTNCLEGACIIQLLNDLLVLLKVFCEMCFGSDIQ